MIPQQIGRFSKLKDGVRRGALMEQCEARMMLSVDVLTSHNDLSRDGLNSNETVLTTSNVNTSSFRKLFGLTIKGQTYAQPLVVSGLVFPHGQGVIHRNMVYVATADDIVYAFDADRGDLVWTVHTLGTTLGETPIPSTDLPSGNTDITPNIGIIGTPVIDRSSDTMYLVAQAKRGSSTYVTRLYALNILTGAKVDGGPIFIGGSVAGSGDGSNNGVLTFDSILENQRSALTLLNGEVYITFAGHGDPVSNYHGWVFAYNAATLHQDTIWADTPDGGFGGIWMGGAGISADSEGNLYFTAGNGDFDADSGGSDFGDSIVKVPTANNAPFEPTDFFAPQDQSTDNSTDTDFGSTGVMLLPPGSTPVPEGIIGSKEGSIYVVDLDNLGGFDPSADNVVQVIPANGSGKDLNTSSYFNGNIYIDAAGDAMEEFTVQNDGTLALVGQTPSAFTYPGVKPSISANGTSNGIVWVIANISGRAVLQAYDANNLSDKLYGSNLEGKRDRAGVYTKFTAPTVANGKVFVETNGELDIYGLG